MTSQQALIARWSAIADDTCQCGRTHCTLLGLDGDRLIYQCPAGHLYRVVDLSRITGGKRGQR